MRIAEVRIHRYGPLSDFALTDVGDFTLLFGENESGKTLTLDAILRFLLRGRRERGLFPRLDRVEHDPDGFIDVNNKGQTLRFPAEESLADLLGIHAEDLRNALVVRASDLQVQEGQQREYYAALTDRLMGIHRETMNQIIAKLRDIGRLTSGGALSDSESNEKMKSRLESAHEVLTRIETLEEDLLETNMIELERSLLDAEEARHNLDIEQELQEQAGKRERYQDGRDLVRRLQERIAEIDSLPEITQQHYDDWRDAENTIKSAESAVQLAETEIAELTTDLEKAKETASAAKHHLRELEIKEATIQDLGEETRIYRKKVEADAGRSSLLESAPRLVAVSTILFLASLGATVLRAGNTFFLGLTILFGFFVATGLALWLWLRIQIGQRRREWEALRLSAEEIGFQVEGLEQLLRAIEDFSKELNLAREDEHRASSEQDRLEERNGVKREEVQENRGKIEEAEEKLSEIKEELGVKTLKKLRETREQREGAESTKQELLTKLEERFGEVGDSIEAKIKTWNERIAYLAEYGDAAPGIEHNPGRVTELQEEIANLGDQIKTNRDELQSASTQIAEIAEQASLIMWLEETMPGDTIEDLRSIEKSLDQFCQKNEEQAEFAGIAIEILEEIRNEQEERVKDLFGEDDQASSYFRNVTDGAYERVDYDPESGKLIVVRSNDEILPAYALSSGTYDQLYLATRLSLANRLLGGEKGFLLLDDPFLTSDNKRLGRQLEILLDLARQDWQIVYFSVKEEVWTSLKKMKPGDIYRSIKLAPLAV